MTSSMRDALMHAKLAMVELQAAARQTDARLTAERAELETVRRRLGLAAQIGDAETVAIAERFAAQHAERVAMLETKQMVQQQELTMVEREYDAMSVQLRTAMSGFAAGDPLGGLSPDASARGEVDALPMDDPLATAERTASDTGTAPTRRTRAEKEANAESRLADLKRRLGK